MHTKNTNRIVAIILCIAVALTAFSVGIFAIGDSRSVQRSTEYTCNCGEDAPSNLAYHSDSCPRKQYIRTLFDGKTVAEIYAQWSIYDEATRTDILNMTQVYVTTTYDGLYKLVYKNISSVDGVKVKVEGVDEDVYLTAKKVSRYDYSDAAFDFVGNKRIVFAYDLTLKDNDGEWQPSAGKNVTVSIDAAALKLDDGERIGILHEHGGKLENLGISTVVSNTLTFKTDGFSTFYGYTVDFEYDGVWHSISGGAGIYISDLFHKLGIDRNAEDVTKVEFSDPSLIEVKKYLALDTINVHEEWYLQSVKPFDTEEVLTVTFSNGDVIKINTYDAITDYYNWSNQTFTYGNSGAPGVISDTIGFAGTQVSISGTCTIIISGDVVVKCQFYIPSGATLKIRSATGTSIIYRDRGSLTDDMFLIDGGKLDIRPYDNDQEGEENDNKGSVIIDGGIGYTVTDDATMPTQKNLTSGITDYNASAIFMYGGTLMTHRVKFQNFVTFGERASVLHSTAKDTAAVSDSNYARIYMRDCDIVHCATTGTNSVILLDDAKTSMTNCRINDCYSGVLTYAGVLKGSGAKFSHLTMSNCTMDSNYSSGWGGAILWAANQPAGTEISQSIIDNCTFTNNTAKWLGGAISNEAIMKVTNTIFKNNRAQSGGAIASFPFTLTDDTDTNSVGLTLGTGNVISNNTAVATADFIEDITGVKQYPAGGAGIWVYLNKEKWNGYLDIGSGNYIMNNKSEYRGGGVFIATQAVATTELKIVGASIHDNTAVYGGGIASETSNVILTDGSVNNNTATKFGGGIYLNHGSCVVSGTGSVNENTAANGGGLYIENGTLNVNGGVVISNVARGSYTGATAQNAQEGVGGGIYVKEGSFTMTGNSSGLHSNTASIAADDAYATGGLTTLVLPDVKSMDLTGWKGSQNPTGWFADYMPNDTLYPLSVLGRANPGRYFFDDVNKLEVEHPTLDANKTAYYCLTIGTPHPGYGDLHISKTLTSAAKEDQTFVFDVIGKTKKPETDYSLTVTLIIKKGETHAEVLISQIPDGTYTVTERTSWSWRYELTECDIYPKDGEKISGNTIEVGILESEWYTDFTNEAKENKWLSGDCYCENIWKKKDEEAPSKA